jgi:hypothetical protein
MLDTRSIDLQTRLVTQLKPVKEPVLLPIHKPDLETRLVTR